MKKNKLPELSLFFPAYNEEENIELAVKTALSVLPKLADKFEIVVVNDGSADKTAEITKKLSLKYKVVRIVSQQNMGYGGALKLGFESARYDWVFFTDADLQFDLSEMKNLVSHADEKSLVIGFRKQRAEGWKRALLMRALHVWNKVFLFSQVSVRDVDCAFKLIPKQAIREISPLSCNGAMISTELLMKAQYAGYMIKEVGVSHFPRLAGKPTGNNLRVIFRAVFETFLLQKFMLDNLLSSKLFRPGMIPTPSLAS